MLEWFLVLLGLILWFRGAAAHKRRRLALEIMVVFSAILLMTGWFAEQIPSVMAKARLLAVMAPVFTGRMKGIEEHAFSGEWPGKAEPDKTLDLKIAYVDNQYYTGSWLGGIQPGGYIGQGAIQIEIEGRKRNHPRAPADWWSLRPAVADGDSPTVLWVCGSRQPPAGFHALGENLTTLPPEENFGICREQNKREPR